MYFNMNGTNKGVDYGLVTLEIQGPPLMPPGLNSDGRTLPGRHGVAASPPGSQVFAHMRSSNNATLAAWALSVGPMASRGRDQMAPSPVCQVGFVAATCEMPHGRRIGGGGRAREECAANKDANEQTHKPVTFASVSSITVDTKHAELSTL